MIGIDTNVLVRFIVQDEPKQSRVATKLIEASLSATNKGFISSIVLCEVVWVLKRLYRQPKDRLLLVVKTILETEVFEVEHRLGVTHLDAVVQQPRVELTEVAHLRVGGER